MSEPTGVGPLRALRRLRKRVVAASPRPSRLSPRQLVAGGASVVICLVAGFMIGTSASLAQGTDLRGGRNVDLISMVAAESQRNAELAGEVARARDEVDRLSGATDVGGMPAAQLEAAELAAHTLPMRGPGVTVVLDDAPSWVSPPDVDPDLLVVHQQDIQAVVNALWKGGAEAMTIQGQRVVSTTGIKCVGNTVVLHGIPYAPPYRIEAIGDPDALEAALADSEYVTNYQDYVAAYGLVYQQRRSADLTFPAYEGRIELQYASPAT